MKRIICMNAVEFGKILEMHHMNCRVTVELNSEGLDGRWVEADIYLNDEQMKAFHKIMVRDNINRRGRDEADKSAG